MSSRYEFHSWFTYSIVLLFLCTAGFWVWLTECIVSWEKARSRPPPPPRCRKRKREFCEMRDNGSSRGIVIIVDDSLIATPHFLERFFDVDGGVQLGGFFGAPFLDGGVDDLLVAKGRSL